MRSFRYVLPEGGPNTAPEFAGDIISLGWLSNNLVCPQMSWKKRAGWGKFGILCLNCSPTDPNLEKQSQMDRWIEFYANVALGWSRTVIASKFNNFFNGVEMWDMNQILFKVKSNISKGLSLWTHCIFTSRLMFTQQSHTRQDCDIIPLHSDTCFIVAAKH